MPLNLNHQTAAQFADRLKARWFQISKYDRARLANWLYNRYTVGDITQAQIRTAFGLDTTAKWTAFRDRMTVLRDYYLSIESEV